MDNRDIIRMALSAADCRTGRQIKPCVRWGAVAWVLWSLTILACGPAIAAEEAEPREYDVKAAFIYNFLMFVDGLPFQEDDRDEQATDKKSEPNEVEPIRIGVIGQDPFKDSFEVVVKRRIAGHRIVIEHFKGLADPNGSEPPAKVHPQIEQIRKCDVIFLCASEGPYIDVLLKPISTRNILTVADRSEFLEKGVVIDFVTEQSKIRFDINLIAAKKAKLTIRSKLLRLARRIIE
jgi:hypothetical protein